MHTKARLALRAVVVTALIVGALSVDTVTATSTEGAEPAVACTLDARLVNPCRPLFGAYSNTYPGLSGWRAHMDAEEQRIGRPLDIVHLYHPPGGAPPLTAEERYFATRPGTIMFTNWKPATKWRDAAGGNATVNAQIDQVADSIASIAPARMMLTIHHEPEPDVTPGTSSCPRLKGSYGSPADYRAMWRNIHDRFEARGVTNVVWVMDYMGYVGWDCLVPELWPGNDLVDWVMYDPYNTAATHTWSGSVARFYNLLATTSNTTHDYDSKVWGLAEFGVGGSTSQAHAYDYYQDARDSIERHEFPRLKAYIAFDSEGVVHTRTSYSVAGALDVLEQQHFTALANSPALNGPLTPDTSPPVASLVAPSGGDTVSGLVTVRAEVGDDIAVTGATFTVDAGPPTTMSVDAGGIASAVWSSTSVPDGIHDLSVSVTDAAGNSSSSSVTVTVTNADTTPPGAPSALRTRSVTGGTVDLAWSPATDDRGISAYRVTRDGETMWSGPETRFIDASVEPGGTYLYEVTAVDGAGNVSTDAATLTVQTPDTADVSPPSTPELNAHLSGGDVVLTWSEAADDSGISAYRLLRDGEVVATLDGEVTGFTDEDLVQGRSYAYAVQAVDHAGNAGGPSEARSVLVPDTTSPGPPGTLTAVEDILTGGVLLGWQPSSDNLGVAGYRISRNGELIAEVSTPGYIDMQLSQGATYDYTVTAYDAAGNTSGASNPVRVVRADRTAPSTPATPTGWLQGSAVHLTWQASTDNVGVTAYRVRRDDGQIATVAGTSYTDAGAVQGKTHRYSIVAVDAANNASPPSGQLVVLVPDTTPPAKPAKPTLTLTSGKASISWKAPTDNVGVVRYALRRGGTLLVTTTARTWTDATVAQGKSYSYTVTAYDAADNASAASPAASLTVPDTIAPTTPTNLKGIGGSRKVTLTWSAASDNVAVTGYEVWRGTTRLGTTKGLTYTNTGLNTGSSYNYKVRSYDAAGRFSAYTALVKVKAK